MQTTTSVTRVDLDPRELLVDVNIRTNAGVDKDFVASIKDLGVLVPITAVRTTTGDVRVRFGHRRTLAAIEADLATVPVDIVGDESTDDAGKIERILTQHAENAHRAPLLESEQLGVVEQLNAFGMSAAQIAKRTKIKRDTVNTALAVAKSDLAKAATDRYDFLTLEHAAAVAEFDDEPEAVKQLIVTAQQGQGFLHLLQRLRDEREARAAKQPIIDELVAAGVTVVDRPRWTDPTKALAQLGTSDDPLTPEAHASCAGHVAWIDEEWIELPDDKRSDDSDNDDDNYELTYVTVYGCSDPVTYGHIEPSVRNSRNGRQVSDEEAKAERQRVLRNNKAWRASENVRRNWLRTFLRRKSAPKGAHRFVFVELTVGSYRLRDALDKQHRTACELVGIESKKALIDAMNDASDARAQVIALALVLSAHEACLGVHTWRNPDAATAQYLSQLTAWGYELSEIEQSVIKSHSDGE